MTCHALVPLFVCAPVLLHIIFAFAHLDVILSVRVTSILLNFLPIIKPFIVIAVVPNYRRALVHAYRASSSVSQTMTTNMANGNSAHAGDTN